MECEAGSFQEPFNCVRAMSSFCVGINNVLCVQYVQVSSVRRPGFEIVHWLQYYTCLLDAINIHFYMVIPFLHCIHLLHAYTQIMQPLAIVLVVHVCLDNYTILCTLFDHDYQFVELSTVMWTILNIYRGLFYLLSRDQRFNSLHNFVTLLPQYGSEVRIDANKI